MLTFKKVHIHAPNRQDPFLRSPRRVNKVILHSFFELDALLFVNSAPGLDFHFLFPNYLYGLAK
jgi:hypothetical protein